MNAVVVYQKQANALMETLLQNKEEYIQTLTEHIYINAFNIIDSFVYPNMHQSNPVPENNNIISNESEEVPPDNKFSKVIVDEKEEKRLDI